jgi:Fic family protein
MVVLRKKKVGAQDYYYLEQTYKEKGTVKKVEKYLGKEVPKDLENLKTDLMTKVYQEQWYPLLDSIAKAHLEEAKSMSKSLTEKEMKTFSIKFTYDTNRIEGSTLTLRETADLIERGVAPNQKPIKDAKDAEAHEKLFYTVLNWKKDLSMQTILYWHKELLEGTHPDIAGRVRQHQVAILGSKFMPPFPVEIEPLMREFLAWYAKNKTKLHPVELAALLHLKFVTIHPFADGNGRISRLLMNFVLNKNKFPMLNIPYEKRRSYYNALERSQVSKDDSIFVQWLFRRYIKEYKGYLK